MEVLLLFAQRKCKYEGQYAPELLAAIDACGNDENPDYIQDALEKAEDDTDLLFFKLLTLRIPKSEFDSAFFPVESILHGMVSDENRS